jgi:hypothetical protein
MKNITFELKGTEYTLPKYLTIGDYVKIFKVKNLFEDEYFAIKLINIITGAPMDLLLKANRQVINNLSGELLKIIPTREPSFVDRFELDGVEYGFIPSWKDMSFGEFADLDTLMTKKPEEMLNYLHIITAILYRPITKSKSEHKFEIEEYNVKLMEERAELFKNKLNVEYALGSQFFFIHFAKIYSKNILTSSMSWMRMSWIQIKFAWKWRKEIWKSLWRKNSDGTLFLTELQMMILQDTILSLRKELSKD